MKSFSKRARSQMPNVITITSRTPQTATLLGRVSDNGYHTIRFECLSRQRPMRHVAISQGYDLVGLRCDRQTQDSLLILEHDLTERGDEE